MKTYIPTNGEDHASTVEEIRKVCLELGFFYVTVTVLKRRVYFEQMKAFFDLPVEEKKLVVDATRTHGYTAMREETLDLSKQTTAGYQRRILYQHE